MCDYSLMSFPNRLARDGEELVIYQFACGAKGLTTPMNEQEAGNSRKPERRNVWQSFWNSLVRSSDSAVAVCIPDGARLMILDVPKRLQREFSIHPSEAVTFVQLSASSFEYRDAIRFRNGQQILLQGLQEGQKFRVLDLSSAHSTEWPLNIEDRTIPPQPQVDLPAVMHRTLLGRNV